MHFYYYFEETRGAGTQSVTVNVTGLRFDPNSMKLNIYLKLIFLFLRSGVQAKRGVPPLITQCFQNSAEMDCLYTTSSAYPAVCGIH